MSGYLVQTTLVAGYFQPLSLRGLVVLGKSLETF